MKSKKIISVGDIVADLIFEFPSFPIQKDDFIVAKGGSIEAGGNSNFLIAAARLEVEAIALGAVGDDEWGNSVIEILNDENVDMTNLAVDGSTTVVLVLVDQNGDHAFMGKYGDGEQLVLDNPQKELIASADALFCSGYSLSEKRLSQITLDAIKTAHASRVLTCFDTGPSFDSLPSELKSEVLVYVNTLFLTEDEISGVTSGDVADIFDLGPETVVVKKGPGGCDVFTKSGRTFSQPGFAVEVKDTTAAGDSFAAGFIVGMVNAWGIEDCAKLANAVGAAKVKKLGGGRNVPTLDEIKGIIAEFKLDIKI